MNVLLVGDIHSSVAKFNSIAAANPDKTVVQLGDFGFGFNGIAPDTFVAPNGLFLRGNHDAPELARKHFAYLGDFGYRSDLKAYYISGAYSIDYQWRIPGESWWPEEELSYPQLADCINHFVATKPEIVISHECPGAIGTKLLMYHKQRPYKLPSTLSRTAMAMEQMFGEWKPKLWVFGHYHLPYDQVHLGTRFVCLPEFETLEYKTEDYK